jgi:hypothetical protein
MATLHFVETMNSTPEQFVAALTDFGPGRSEVFGNSADDYLKVHQRGATRLTSQSARGASGSACTMTGPIRTGSP